MAKKKKSEVARAKKASNKNKLTRPSTSNAGGLFKEESLATVRADAALYATFSGEAALGLVECCSPPTTTMIQHFVVYMREVPASPGSRELGNDWARQNARSIFEDSDYGKKPLRRVLGRILDELHNHRGEKTCSVSEVFFVLLDEIPDELEERHQQLLGKNRPQFDTSRSATGHRNVDNCLRELRGQPRKDDHRERLTAYVTTTTEPKRGVEVRYRLNELGQWLFDGWPALPILAERRNR